MQFDKRVTNVCKGVAVMMLLAHHLWWKCDPAMLPRGLVGIAVSCKLCVAMFLLLSGYGLAKRDMETLRRGDRAAGLIRHGGL